MSSFASFAALSGFGMTGYRKISFISSQVLDRENEPPSRRSSSRSGHVTVSMWISEEWAKECDELSGRKRKRKRKVRAEDSLISVNKRVAPAVEVSRG